MNKITKDPIKILKEKLYDIKATSDIRRKKRTVSFDELKKSAEKAKKTFTENVGAFS